MRGNIERLLKWRKENPNWNELRLSGLRKSKKAKSAAVRVGKLFKKQRLLSRSKHARMKKDENHCSGKWFELRSPENKRYSGKNLHHFIKQHEDLFHADDIKWKLIKNSRGTNEMCRAYSGLSSLRRKSRTEGSWKGWTIVSKIEMVTNKSEDLLCRHVTDGEEI